MAQATTINNGIQTFKTSQLYPTLPNTHIPKSLKPLKFGSMSPKLMSFTHKKTGVVPKVQALVATSNEKSSSVPEIVLQPIKDISGTVQLPGSKSLSNRILLLAALSEGTTVVDNLLYSDDIRYMLDALRTLGLNVEDDKTAKRETVEGCGGLFPAGKEGRSEIELFLGNAGTAMRPLTAAVAVAGGNSSYILGADVVYWLFKWSDQLEIL